MAEGPTGGTSSVAQAQGAGRARTTRSRSGKSAAIAKRAIPSTRKRIGTATPTARQPNPAPFPFGPRFTGWRAVKSVEAATWLKKRLLTHWLHVVLTIKLNCVDDDFTTPDYLHILRLPAK